MLSPQLQTKTLSKIRKKILGTINLFLKETEKSFPGFGLRLDFSKYDKDFFLSYFFTVNNILGLLQASYFDSTNLFSMFLSSIVDTVCKTVDKPDITSLFYLVLWTDQVDSLDGAQTWIKLLRLRTSWNNYS